MAKILGSGKKFLERRLRQQAAKCSALSKELVKASKKDVKGIIDRFAIEQAMYLKLKARLDNYQEET